MYTPRICFHCSHVSVLLCCLLLWMGSLMQSVYELYRCSNWQVSFQSVSARRSMYGRDSSSPSYQRHKKFILGMRKFKVFFSTAELLFLFLYFIPAVKICKLQFCCVPLSGPCTCIRHSPDMGNLQRGTLSLEKCLV